MSEGKSSNNKNNDNDNNSRTAIITGSYKGIGKAVAMEFAKAGYCVMINDFEQEGELKHTAYEISKAIGGDSNNSNPRVGYFVGDVSEEQISISLVEDTMKRFGRIDVLVNNAAIAQKNTTPKKATTKTKTTTNESSTNSNIPQYSKQVSPYFTLEEYEVADTSLKAMYLCIREVTKKMVETVMTNNKNEENDKIREKKSGLYSIINISSSYESIPKPDVDAYTLSMSGVNPFTSSRVGVKTLTKTVALQLAEKGIRVNAIAPGLIATDINEKLLENEEIRKERENQIPFHRIGTPEEIAKIAIFLASDDARYVTGSLIYADGGLSLPRSNYFLESDIEED